MELRKFIKTTIREFLNESKINDFNEEEKAELISFYRNHIFDKVRGTELYKKYNGDTIPYGFSQNSWDLLLQGIRDSGLDVNTVLNNRIKRLENYIKTPISIDFNPSTGGFAGFVNKQEKKESIKKVKKEINLLKKFIATTITEYLNENVNKDLSEFLLDKKFTNPKSKQFLYHGTSISPEKFNLRDDYDFEDSNSWSGDLPEGYLFLTTNLREAKAYGQYVIPCELKWYDNKTFNVNANNPSQIFDKDYGIDLYKNDKYYGFLEKFEDSGKSVLIIKGTDRSTVITYSENVIPRTDLAIEFYNVGGKNKTKR